MTSFTPLALAMAKVRRSRWAAGVALAGFIALVTAFLLVAPVPLAFVVVVAGAVAWCIWLERHPEMD